MALAAAAAAGDADVVVVAVDVVVGWRVVAKEVEEVAVLGELAEEAQWLVLGACRHHLVIIFEQNLK